MRRIPASDGSAPIGHPIPNVVGIPGESRLIPIPITLGFLLLSALLPCPTQAQTVQG